MRAIGLLDSDNGYLFTQDFEWNLFTKSCTGSEVLPNASPIRKHTAIGRSILPMHFFISKRVPVV